MAGGAVAQKPGAAPSQEQKSGEAPASGQKSELDVARNALQDRLYLVAERHAEKALHAGTPEQRREASLALLEAYAGQKKYDEILKQRSIWSKTDPAIAGTNAPPRFVYWYALALLEKGNFQESAQIAQAAATEKSSQTGNALLRIAARAKQKSGDKKEAWALFSEVDKRSTSNAVCRADNALEWAVSLDADQQYADALKVLKMQSELPVHTPSKDDGMLLRGRILLKQKQSADAASVFNQLAMNDHATEWARVQALVEMSVHTWNNAKTNEAIAYARSAFSRASKPEIRRFSGFRLGDLLIANPKTQKEGCLLTKELVRQFPEAPESMRAQLKLADSMLQIGNSKQAAAEYQIFLETYPASSLDSRVLQGRGWALLKLGEFNNAYATFLSAADRSQDEDEKVECLLKAADALMGGGRYQDAAAIYQKIQIQFPKSRFAARALFQRADALERDGEDAEAIQVYSKMAEIYRTSEEAPQALLRLAALQAKQGDSDASIKTYSSILNEFKDQKIRMAALMGRGKTYYQNYKFNSAMQDFATIAENDLSLRDEARFMLTVCLYGVGRDKEARVAAGTFLTDFPNSNRLPDMTLWLAKFEFNHSQYVEAKRLFQNYITRWPEARWADAAMLWGARASFFENDFTGCIEGVTRLIKAFPKSGRLPEAMLLQADALIELARFDEAVLLLDRVIAQVPESDWAARAWLRKGDCLYTMGADNSHRYEEALDAYRIRLKKGKLTPSALLQIHFKIAWCYEKMNQLDEAVNAYYTDVMLRYQNERQQGVWFNDDATELFIRAAFRAATLCEEQGKIEQAIGILQRVVRLNVSGADEAKTRIERLQVKKAGM